MWDFWASPDGPSLPFGNPTLIVFDAIRVVIVLMALAVVIATPAAMYRVRRAPGQLLRLASTAILMVSLLSATISHIGDYGHWRLAMNLIATTGLAWGMWSLFYWENPATIHPHRATNSNNTIL